MGTRKAPRGGGGGTPDLGWIEGGGVSFNVHIFCCLFFLPLVLEAGLLSESGGAPPLPPSPFSQRIALRDGPVIESPPPSQGRPVCHFDSHIAGDICVAERGPLPLVSHHRSRFVDGHSNAFTNPSSRVAVTGLQTSPCLMMSQRCVLWPLLAPSRNAVVLNHFSSKSKPNPSNDQRHEPMNTPHAPNCIRGSGPPAWCPRRSRWTSRRTPRGSPASTPPPDRNPHRPSVRTFVTVFAFDSLPPLRCPLPPKLVKPVTSNVFYCNHHH